MECNYEFVNVQCKHTAVCPDTCNGVKLKKASPCTGSPHPICPQSSLHLPPSFQTSLLIFLRYFSSHSCMKSLFLWHKKTKMWKRAANVRRQKYCLFLKTHKLQLWLTGRQTDRQTNMKFNFKQVTLVRVKSYPLLHATAGILTPNLSSYLYIRLPYLSLLQC